MRMKSFLLVVASAATLWASAAAATERHEEGDEHEAREEQVEERYRANFKALHGFIDEATALQQQFLKDNDSARIQQGSAAWESRVAKYLRKHLAPMYATEFLKAKAAKDSSGPEGKDAKGGAVYRLLDAKKVALRNDLSELRKPD